MPNTLAHAGAQGLATRTALPDADLKWVYLGCVIPDVPWILQRVARVGVPGLDPYLLRSYVIIQASLLGCLVLSTAVALLARDFWRVLALLGGNAGLHLVLDAMQTKWGNGVHFFAPVSWEITNWGLFWPESIPTYTLTAFGLLYMGWHWRASGRDPPEAMWPGVSRVVGIVILLGSYVLGPLVILQQPIEADAHSLNTLSQSDGKVGRSVAMDRARYGQTKNGYVLFHFGGRVRVEDMGISAPATVSVRGVFTAEDKIRVNRLHVHASGLRDYPSYLGLTLIAAIWGWSILGCHDPRAWSSYFSS